MKTLSLQSKITADGCLHLHLPCGLPPGDAEVVVVVQPMSNARQGPPFPSDEGVWAGKVPDIDIEADLKEMNQL
ncbi:MAG: hypothetical protein WBX00_20425 [Isosphaeraceae bacterium]